MRKHWYKEQRSKEYRRALYRALSHAGLPWELAARMRDWSEPHVKTFLSSNAHLLNKPPDEVWADFHQELVKEVFKVGDGSVVGGQE
ncbi:MAG: hypothetical protein H0Z33_16715 [Bacillaceae bacterium]|nr:hypothetical protein [Bacillaceae bacterium]